MQWLPGEISSEESQPRDWKQTSLVQGRELEVPERGWSEKPRELFCASLTKHMYALHNKILFNFCPAASNGFLQQTYNQYKREPLKLRDYNQTLKHISKTVPLYKAFSFPGKHLQQGSQCVFPTGFMPVQQNLRIKIQDGRNLQRSSSPALCTEHQVSQGVLQPLWTISSST